MDDTTSPEPVYLVETSQARSVSRTLYRNRNAAEAAQAWFEEHGYGPIPIHEVSVEDTFDPPTGSD